MAGETILVVDDAPITLKLAAAVLRSEGYRVHLYSTAEQALSALRTMRPDLILLDLRLPGMDGFELTSLIRQDPRTRDLPVIAFSASSGVEEQHTAFEAGFDGFIPKPLDTRTLGSRLRVFLDGQPPAAPAPASEPLSSAASEIPAALPLAGPEMEALRRGFLADAAREVRRLLELLNTGFDAGAASRLFHQWIGSAGALGYREIAEEARKAESLLSSNAWNRNDLRPILSDLAVMLATPREAAETPIPESILRQLSRKRIAMVGFADAEADRVCSAIGAAGAVPYLFGVEEPVDSDPVRCCAVVMIHVRPGTSGSAWLEPRTDTVPGPPWVFVGGREHIIGLDPSVQARAVEFLIDGWQPEEVVMRLSFALSRAETIASRTAQSASEPSAPLRRPVDSCPSVVIADDDINVLAVVRCALENMQMECCPASNGPEALRLIRETAPQAAVLDVNMPGMDGFEVLAAIRRENLPVRVVMLTARQRELDVLRGFELGADDYVVKPFNPLELMARIKRLTNPY